MIVYFAQGVYLAKPRKINTTMWGVIAAIGLLLSYAESNYYLNEFNNVNFAGLKPSMYIYSFAIIMFLFSDKVRTLYNTYTNVITEFIVKLGRVSFIMYLSHIMFEMAFNKLLDYIPEIFNNWCIKCIVVILVNYMFIVMLRKIIPSKLYRYIGMY